MNIKEKTVFIIGIAVLFCAGFTVPNNEAKIHKYSKTIEKERPQLNEETKRLIAAYRKNPTAENRDALRKQVELNYDAVIARKIAKLDHDAAMQAFSAFINDQSLNQKQIAFVHKIIHHIELNGYMENAAELTKPPFDKPVSFIKLFDANTRSALLAAINQIRENAVQIAAS